nr:hypothetical protein Iba_chr04bCG4120 [Ipomoea batatas]
MGVWEFDCSLKGPNSKKKKGLQEEQNIFLSISSQTAMKSCVVLERFSSTGINTPWNCCLGADPQIIPEVNLQP